MAQPTLSAKAATEPTRVQRAFKDAFIAALVMLGLSVPILALRTEQNMSNEVILIPRPWLVVSCCLIVFVGRLLLGLFVFNRAPDAKPLFETPTSLRTAWDKFAPYAAQVGLGAIIAYPLVALYLGGPQGAIKWIDNFGIQILIYIMLGWGLNIVVGLAGLLDLGYVAFYAVGAYSYALIATKVIPATYPDLGVWAFWICLPISGILAAMWGVILGFPVLRLRGDYLAIVTLAFGEIIRLVLINWVDFSGGYAGLSSIPRPSFFGIPFNASETGFAAKFGLEFSPIYRTVFLYYVILVLSLITAFVTLRLRRLPVGRAWEALREDEIACRSLGINTVSTKLTAFSIGAMFGGFAGAFFAARQGFISPESFVFLESAQILAIVVLGGMGSLFGVVIASIALVGGIEILRELDFLKAIFGPSFDPTQYRMLIFGLAMVLMMLWKPRGLISHREPTVFLKERKSISSSLVQEGHG
ncbi:MAG: high-affinity branched-chain amino acid ABC transporter permease LivM [Beijerinckiaceae bacterium]|nr:high-affinity branched-chain amino acid ABC transporter permease LivM [Beijerinckiaceae bacterium]